MFARRKENGQLVQVPQPALNEIKGAYLRGTDVKCDQCRWGELHATWSTAANRMDWHNRTFHSSREA